jgi:hypothetical protein
MGVRFDASWHDDLTSGIDYPRGQYRWIVNPNEGDPFPADANGPWRDVILRYDQTVAYYQVEHVLALLFVNDKLARDDRQDYL